MRHGSSQQKDFGMRNEIKESKEQSAERNRKNAMRQALCGAKLQ